MKSLIYFDCVLQFLFQSLYCSRGDGWAVIYTACKSLAKKYRLFLSTSHFDLEGWQMYLPAGFCGGGRIPPGITNIFKNWQFLMDSKDLCIYE